MVLSGSYNNYHLASTAGGSPSAYLVNFEEGDFEDSGFFPTSNAEQNTMWWNGSTASGIGITCIECFFYLDEYPTSGNPYMFRTRSRRVNNNGDTNTSDSFYVRLLNNGTFRVFVRAISPGGQSSDGTESRTIDIVNANNFLNIDQWYHLVIRISPGIGDNRVVEVLIGNTGKSIDGTDHGGAVSNLTVPFSIQNPNEGSYYRAADEYEDAQGGPFALFFKWNSTDMSANTNQIRIAIGTDPQTSSQRLNGRSIPGGLAEFRFWKSNISNTKSYFELENNKNKPVVYSPDGDYPDLVHCFRLNETGASLSAADYADVGQYTGRFFDTYSNVDNITPYVAGYPYDIASFTGDPPEPKFVTGHSAGHAKAIDFFGQQFATGVGGVPYYREALPAELGAVSQPDTFDQLAENNTPVRIAVRDYYNGLVYLLPGTGTVQEDVPDDIDTTLGLEGIGLFVTTDVFYPLAGKDVVYSQFYLIEDASLTEGLDNINYYASSISGPSIVVVNDSGVGFITESEALGG